MTIGNDFLLRPDTTTSENYGAQESSDLLKHQDNSSDYGHFGSDAEELEILDQLVAQAATPHDTPFTVSDIEDYEPPRRIRVQNVLELKTRKWSTQESLQDNVEIVCGLETQGAKPPYSNNAEAKPLPSAETPREQDNRSPLERFRRPPKKILSVTDLISPSWCELQYAYTLSKHGRKKRTRAMKQGSAVHQALEDEIHTAVPVKITSIEDNWGLRIWNICQGLQTLRETGRTRELEVWGTIDGELVNGVIDELTYECPDVKSEANDSKPSLHTPTLSEYQTSIAEFLLSNSKPQTSGPRNDTSDQVLKASKRKEKRMIYIIDVKTRTSSTLPTGSSITPTILQLHLYHHMLENLAQGKFQLNLLAERFHLDVQAKFSDAFLAQLGNINQEMYLETENSASQQDPNEPATHMPLRDSMDVLLENNNLSLLWDYMLLQFRQTFLPDQQSDPDNTATLTSEPVSDLSTSSSPARLSPLLTAEYLAHNYKHVAGTSKKFLGRKSFQFDPTYLKTYLDDNLQWWRGERSARGVEVQEAWKCRGCDFRSDCEWIHQRDAAALQEAMDRKRMREIAGVEDVTTNKSKV